MNAPSINFDVDIVSRTGTLLFGESTPGAPFGIFIVIEPGDGTRYCFNLRRLHNGVMGWSRLDDVYEITLYDGNGRSGSSILFADTSDTFYAADLQFPYRDVWKNPHTRRVTLALVNHLLGRNNPYAGAFTDDPETDGYSV